MFCVSLLPLTLLLLHCTCINIICCLFLFVWCYVYDVSRSGVTVSHQAVEMCKAALWDTLRTCTTVCLVVPVCVCVRESECECVFLGADLNGVAHNTHDFTRTATPDTSHTDTKTGTDTDTYIHTQRHTPHTHTNTHKHARMYCSSYPRAIPSTSTAMRLSLPATSTICGLEILQHRSTRTSL